MGRSLGAQGGQGVAAFYSFSLEMNIFKMRAAGPGPRTPGPAARILKMFISVSAVSAYLQTSNLVLEPSNYRVREVGGRGGSL